MRESASRLALRPALLFALIAGLWVLLAEFLLRGLITDANLLALLDALKDEAFVIFTALLLYFLLRAESLSFYLYGIKSVDENAKSRIR